MARSSRIGHSILDAQLLSRVIRLKWGWQQATCQFWSRSMGDTYLVEQRNRRAYLKIYRHGWRSKAEIQGEVDLLRFLGRRGIRISLPIRDARGEFVQHVSAPEGRRLAVLFSEAEGVVPAFNPENSRKYGRLAATIHKATDSFPGRVRRPQLGIEQLAREPLERIHPFLSRRPRDLAYLTRLSGELADAVTSLLPGSAPEFGMCHGDLTFGNVRRDGRGRLTLFDFDCSGYGWRAYDLAVFLQTRGFDFGRRASADRMKQWNAFLDGYHMVRHLSPGELEAVTLFVPLRMIWQMGAPTNQLAEVGNRSVHRARFESHLAFIKDWLRVRKPL